MKVVSYLLRAAGGGLKGEEYTEMQKFKEEARHSLREVHQFETVLLAITHFFTRCCRSTCIIYYDVGMYHRCCRFAVLLLGVVSSL